MAINIGSLNGENLYVGSLEAQKLYLGSELVWSASEPEPVYSSMPFTIKVLSAGTIVFGQYNSTAYVTDSLAFLPYLNGENIANYHPGYGEKVWAFSSTADTQTVNVVPGDVFELYAAGNGSDNFNRLGKGNGTNGGNTSYYTFSGSTAGCEIYGNILSLCLVSDPGNKRFTGYTTWAAAAQESLSQNASYAVCGLLRSMTGLISAENLVLPNDAPICCYLNMFKSSGLVTGPKELNAELCTLGCYASMFESCYHLTESPIIRAVGFSGSGSYWLYQMFKSCSSLNKITCFLDQAGMSSSQRNSYFQNWVQYVASAGNFYKRNGTTWYSGAAGIPNNWTINVYSE